MFNDLLADLILPKQFAIGKCDAHTNNVDPVSQGNSKVEAATKRAAGLVFVSPKLVSMSEKKTPNADLHGLLSKATKEEKALWKKSQLVLKMEFGTGLKTNLVSLNFFIWFTLRKAIENARIKPCIKRADASRHKQFQIVSLRVLQHTLKIKGRNVFSTHNIGRGQEMPSSYPPSDMHFNQLQMDFSELTLSGGNNP